ncbi:dihydrofolate reductase [Naasia lichenicola]|uniref:Dihydrofolate reductase n=2 Tax=Naasia lichenicola TaxID=2565933 RepID=A0A4S4FSN2_9MICO|nr:dihydrofolate reductase [Naasia lichenicola]
MLIMSMGVSADGYITDRNGGIDWGGSSAEQSLFSLEQVGELGGYLLGRRLYEMMLVFETDPAMRETEANAAFADVWTALPKVVFSRTLTAVQGNARLATRSLDEEAHELAASGRDVSIGGAELAAQAIRRDLVDEFRLFRHPILLGGGTPYFPTDVGPFELELIDTRTFASRVVYERYRRVRVGPG